ncbi:MAG: thioredoxin domain-containing protein [Fimbriimonadaceae bacterium]|nr:thioredoxin domain-containing protein [Fimbriimonadaceae bacterium]
MRKPNFGVMTLCLCMLFGIGMMVRWLEPFVPPLPTNRLQDESAPFLRQAMRSIIDWHPMSEEAFAKARREGKPIMLVIGVSSSSLGWTIENQIFTDTDVASFINRHFVCVRIDSQDSPQWLSTYLPLSRAQTGLQRGYQIWFLTPDGRYFDSAANFGTTVPAVWPALLDLLEGQLDKYSERASTTPQTEVTSPHQRDIELLTHTPQVGLPDFQAQASAISALADIKNGGFPVFGRTTLRVGAFRYICLLDDENAFRAWMDPLLTSSIVDWMDGGFFVALNNSNGLVRPDFEKNSLENAEMMQVLGLASALFGEGLYRRLALSTYDQFQAQWDSQGFVWASRLSDVRADGRSPSVSFPPRLLRETLKGSDLDFARDVLGLRVETNPAMTLVLRDPRAALESARFEPVLSKLRSARSKEPKSTGELYLDVNATVLARMLQTARMIGDDDRLQRTLPFWMNIDRFRVADDVVRTIGREDPPRAYLGDYLAYADAALQVFLSTGDPQAFQNGLRVLLRAKEVFVSSSGVWNLMIQAPEQPGPVDVMTPEILDTYKESCTATAIRLCNSYSRLYRDADLAPDSDRVRTAFHLSQTAFNTMTRFAGLSEQIAFFGSGYFCASLGLMDDEHAITVGPQSVSLAKELFMRRPSRLVAPATGDVRPDLQKRKPGVYVISGDKVTGPMTVDQAVREMPARLRLPTR